MEHTPEIQKQFFQFAYQTGSDIWSHIPYRHKAEQMLPKLHSDALVFDIGAGRGLWMMRLLQHGYRVLGMDYIDSIVQKVNKNIKDEGYANKARCVVGNALDIPFIDQGFDLVTDIGTFQHIKQSDAKDYCKEVSRVLKKDGYYLNVSLSQRTQKFMGFSPKHSQETVFTKFGVLYHFYSEVEIKDIFKNEFTILEQQIESYASQSDPQDDIVLLFTLMQKK
jgi:ubiquinone/menaquinone biosynthesis C-methylase UbiE